MFNYTDWVSVDFSTMASENELTNKYREVLLSCGFGVCGVIEKNFEPYGYTSLILLSESHFAIHTFPEENKYYIELSSCIKEPFEKFKKWHTIK